MRVLAVDPGPHIGVAYWNNAYPDAGSPTPAFVEDFQAFEWTPDEFALGIEQWLLAVQVVVCEGFRIGGRRAQEANVTIEMIGVVRFLARRHGVQFVEQEPGAHKFAQGDKLRRLGWYTKGSDHARSATGHLVKFLVGARLIDMSRMVGLEP